MPSNTNFPEMHQSKADLQRIYRGKEGEGFAELQQAIREVTEGKVDLAKRHETLMKGMLAHSADIQSSNLHSSCTEN
jgi:hypothetical protein